MSGYSRDAIDLPPFFENLPHPQPLEGFTFHNEPLWTLPDFMLMRLLLAGPSGRGWSSEDPTS